MSILAGVNTLVAGGITALIGLDHPDEKALKRHKLGQIVARVK